MNQYIVIREAAGEVVGQCTGADARGMCPRVAPGEVVPCAGHVLKTNGHGSWLPYAVPAGEVVCPVTMALALAASPDALPLVSPDEVSGLVALQAVPRPLGHGQVAGDLAR